MNKHNKRVGASFVRRAVPACVAALFVGGVAAQQAKPEGVEEVLVTAQKRTERLQDVPIAISALTASQLESRNILSVADLSAIAPNLSVSTMPGGSTGSQISIRGAVTTNPALFWDTAVGMYVDGVYIGKTTGSVMKMVDLERVEVLRGPQGTLYGRNTMAGAVNFITRKPAGEFSGEAFLSLGTDNERITKLAMDLPKVGIASMSFGLRTEDRDGWIKTTPGSSVSELNNANQMQGRFALNLDFGPNFKADYRFDMSDVDQAPTHSQLVRANLSPLKANNPALYAYATALTPYVLTNRQETATVNGKSEEVSKVKGHAIALEWKLNDNNTLKSITSHRSMDWRDALDLDGSPLSIAHTQRISDYSQKSQELQWVGSADKTNYVLGAYWFKDDGYTNNPQQFFDGYFNFDSRYGFGTESTAIFGQLDYKVTDRLTMTAGLRRTEETKTLSRKLGVNFEPGSPDFLPLIPDGTSASADFSATTPLLVAAFKVNDDTNVYAKYAEGFKSGGFNGEYGNAPYEGGPSYDAVVADNIAQTKVPYRPEKQKTYEVGLKTTFGDGRGQFNVAFFENKVDDLQLSIFTADGAAGSTIRNAGKATVRGLELEVGYAPSRALRLNASYGYLDGKYDEFMEYNAALGRDVNVANNRAFVHAPKHSFSVSADWLMAQTAWGPLRLQADYTYRSSFYTYAYQLDGSNPYAAVAKDSQVDGYGMLNGRLILSDIKAGTGKAQLALWGRNLTDVDKANNYIDFGPGFGNLTPAYFIQPRTVGVSASYKW